MLSLHAVSKATLRLRGVRRIEEGRSWSQGPAGLSDGQHSDYFGQAFTREGCSQSMKS